jgi:uncharacterized membrane protein
MSIPTTIRHRREVSRVEGFSDAVFAFAVTLLVVSLDVPKTYHELIVAIRGFPVFAVCFAILFQIWWRHYRYFRNYELEDAYVITLTGVLLFVVLFYVYPLKFLWSLLFSEVLGQRVTDKVITLQQVQGLFEIYGTGVVATFGILSALYAHAYARRAQLDLTSAGALATRVEIYRNIAIAGIGLLSIVTAAILARAAPNLVAIAGYLYAGIGLTEWGLGAYHGRLRRTLLNK